MGLINWVNKEYYESYDKFYDNGGKCTTCGQFFFGNIYSVKKLYEECLIILDEHINNKFFHADEQIYFYTILKNPELFTLFPTDYFCSPFDVIYPHKRIWTTTEFLIPNLLRDNQYKICKKIMFKLLSSHLIKKINLPDKLLNEYIEFINSYNCMKHSK